MIWTLDVCCTYRALGIQSTPGVSINDSEEGRTVHNIETQASMLTAQFKIR